ncbi:MAG: ribonuclease III [Rikenellaceae bacterium]
MLRLFKRYGKDAHYYKLIRRVFGVWAYNIELYKLALVHRSASIVLEDGSSVNNERLEFLGDAVLELLVSEMLFVAHPDFQEGELTKARSKVVCRNTLNELSRRMGLRSELVVKRHSSKLSYQNMYGDAFEALCGALYLDQGYDRASRRLMELFSEYLDVEKLLHTELDYKSRVLEWAQREHRKLEIYCERSAAYSDNNPVFESVVMLDGKKYGYGSSRSKKNAEQKAARSAFEELGLESH